jgi:hypothetical protein
MQSGVRRLTSTPATLGWPSLGIAAARATELSRAKETGMLVALMLVAFALRVRVLVESARIGADEATVGLMARRILEGERPVFY